MTAPERAVRQMHKFQDSLFPELGETAAVGLHEKFGQPPFSVLDARQGSWKDRKAEWVAMGVHGAEGRRANGPILAPGGTSSGTSLYMASTRDGKMRPVGSGALMPGKDDERSLPPDEAEILTAMSVFDPVLCEVVFRWFCRHGGSVLDPFAGEATKGLVASYLGLRYYGIELRPEQVAANDEQATKLGLNPKWLIGDSANLREILWQLREAQQVPREYDLIFTSPPYYDLEMYSKDEADGSGFGTYEQFMAWYSDIFAQAVEWLRGNSFLVVKVGEIRDRKTGAYRNFVGDNISLFLRLGLIYYNEAVLLTPIGTMAVRAGQAFRSSRKLTKGHQNVLMFYKGNLKTMHRYFPRDIEVGT